MTTFPYGYERPPDGGPQGMGTKVVEVDNRGTRLIELYLQEQYSLKLNSQS